MKQGESTVSPALQNGSKMSFSYLSAIFVSTMVALLFLPILTDSLLKNYPANARALTHALILHFSARY